MVKAVLFDFGQTLVDSADGFRIAEKEAQTRIFADLGVESWPEFLAIYRALRADFHARSEFSRRVLWQAVYSYYGREPDQSFLLQAEWDYWERVQCQTQPFPEAEAVLARLAARYRLALITNTQGQSVLSPSSPAPCFSVEPDVGDRAGRPVEEGTSYRHRLALFPALARFFQVLIVAGEEGIAPKPDPAPFLLCLEQLGILPDEAVYVGDDWRIDVCGAQAVGIQPVWLQHQAVSRRWPRVETIVPMITNLEQLLEIVPGIGEAGR